MSSSPDTLTVDGLTFAVRRSRRRRTIGISVARDGGLALAVPARCRRSQIEQAVCAKLPWVRRKLADLGELPPPREYVTGERLPYLGRRHGLRLVAPDAPVAVALRRGSFHVRHSPAPDARRAHLREWYTAQARRRLAARVAHFGPVIGVVPARLTVRDMRSRWGSCTARGRVSFHWAIVALPPAIADYVVVHELVHLREMNHGAAFWREVETVLPDYRERRAWLTTRGRDYSV